MNKPSMQEKRPHKHAELIKAWADGATIEVRLGNEWSLCGAVGEDCRPSWETKYEYRIKPQPHKWQKEMDAVAAGKPIQYRENGTGGWFTAHSKLGWLENYEYRIKPEQVVRYGKVWDSLTGTTPLTLKCVEGDNLKVTFEDGKLVNAEVLAH